MRHALAACLFLLSCSRAGSKLPPPADYLGMLSVKSLDAAAGRIDSYLKTITPGGQVGLTGRTAEPPLASLLSVKSLDGLAFDKPLHLVCLDPKKFSRPFVLVGTATDAKKLGAAVGEANLKLDGTRALIGVKQTVDAVAPWALATLADAPE